VEWHLDAECTANTDRAKLRLVLHNVLQNAVEYANDGGHVTIEAASGEQQIELRVVNSGSRVGADELRHAFERFWRGDSARSAAADHCGLGLSVCEQVMKLLGGSISVSSTVSGPFTVSIKLDTSASERTRAR